MIVVKTGQVNEIFYTLADMVLQFFAVMVFSSLKLGFDQNVTDQKLTKVVFTFGRREDFLNLDILISTPI
jgi:hypothetical protein